VSLALLPRHTRCECGGSYCSSRNTRRPTHLHIHVHISYSHTHTLTHSHTHSRRQTHTHTHIIHILYTYYTHIIHILYTYIHSLTHSLSHSHTHTHSLTHYLTTSLPHSLTHSPAGTFPVANPSDEKLLTTDAFDSHVPTAVSVILLLFSFTPLLARLAMYSFPSTTSVE
jgi:hypothetical protein